MFTRREAAKRGLPLLFTLLLFRAGLGHSMVHWCSVTSEIKFLLRCSMLCCRDTCVGWGPDTKLFENFRSVCFLCLLCHNLHVGLLTGECMSHGALWEFTKTRDPNMDPLNSRILLYKDPKSVPQISGVPLIIGNLARAVQACPGRFCCHGLSVHGPASSPLDIIHKLFPSTWTPCEKGSSIALMDPLPCLRLL